MSWTARRPGRTTVVLLCSLLAGTVAANGTLGAPGAWAQDYWESEYERNQDELGEARQALGVIGQSIESATAELQVIDQQLAGMYQELADREAELDEANQELEVAKARTAAADAEVVAATVRLQEAQAAREDAEDTFEERVVALWKYGTAGYADAILHAEDISEALLQANYVGRVLENDRNLVDHVVRAEAQITRVRASVDRARDQHALRESSVRSAVTAVERITAVQQELVDRVEVEQSRRRRILDSLLADKRKYQQTIDDLEAESTRIKEELRRSRYAAGRPGKGELVWPTSGAPGSGYGYRTHPISGKKKMHSGVDIAAPTGQKIVAAAAGYVVSAGYRGGYGLCVVIDHGGGVATLYAHQSRVAVSAGDIVSSAETIGYVGSTGYSTGPHLHFEVRVDGTPVDPMDWY